LSRKKSQRGRGKYPNPNRGKGVTHDRKHKSKDETKRPCSHSERGGISRERQGGGRNSSRGRDRGGIRWYACGNIGHMSWEFPKENKGGG
jgi:hypothetical protein